MSSKATDWAARYTRVRAATRALARPLGSEDMQLQSMADASPVKWHLAHTTWFFETFFLGGPPLVPAYVTLFNSYYHGVGAQHPRARRGMLSRPTVEEVWAYRAAIDERVLAAVAAGLSPEKSAILELGLNHEQQHQELILTDIKHAFAENPLLPRYAPPCSQETLVAAAEGRAGEHRFRSYPGGRAFVGFAGDGFSFDNEGPRHEVLVRPFALGSRLVTAGEYRAFIADGGYRRPELWLSDGWGWREAQGIEAPLYWLLGDRLAGDLVFTLRGVRPLADAEPVVHVSLFEADAYARWAGARLPREEELEIALAAEPALGFSSGNFAEAGALHPRPAGEGSQLWGDAWEWTQSPYVAYPGYVTPAGAIGEYNGKFMCNQHVLRGGSCATPRDHLRASYRNFFPAHARWQFTSIRLARDE
jgi:ergothioneine biosynthesis protein EgtB